MRRSQNEIIRLVQKAAEGVAVPAGLDIELGHSAAWLMARQHAILDLLAAELASCIGVTDYSITAPESVDQPLALAAKPSAVLAPLLIDWLAAQVNNASQVPVRWQVSGCTAPLFLCAAAAAYVQRGWWFDLQPAASQQRAAPPSITDLAAEVGKWQPSARFMMTAGYGKRQLEVSAPFAQPQPAAGGYSVPAATWHRLQRLADKVLVPATAASRQNGAGAGAVQA